MTIEQTSDVTCPCLYKPQVKTCSVYQAVLLSPVLLWKWVLTRKFISYLLPSNISPTTEDANTLMRRAKLLCQGHKRVLILVGANCSLIKIPKLTVVTLTISLWVWWSGPHMQSGTTRLGTAKEKGKTHRGDS